MRILHRFRAHILGLLALTLLTGAHPPPEGTEVTGHVGAGPHVVKNGCAGWHYRALEAPVHAQATWRHEAGWTAAAEGTVGPGVVLDDPNPQGVGPYDEGDLLFSGSLALRGGFHSPWVGGEIGVAGVKTLELNDGQLAPLPSAWAWAGVPRHVYVYGRLFTGPLSAAGPMNGGVGLGHADEQMRVSADVWPGKDHIGARLEASGRVAEPWWVGGEVALSNEDWALGPEWRLLVQASWQP